MFYNFRQNNSGGSFDFSAESGISVNVIIEAENEQDAINKAIEIGLYFDGCEKGIDCDCCGDRWSAWIDGTDTPSIYGRPIIDGKYESDWAFKWVKGPNGFIHYADGRIEPFEEVKKNPKQPSVIAKG